MGIFKSIFGGAQERPPVELRDLLFGDMPMDQWPGSGPGAEFPWSAFVSARDRMRAGDREGAIKNWREVVDHAGLESRHYLQAWHFLRQNGQQPPADAAKEVLGIVVEVGMPKGLDTVAAYRDHAARYYNFSGKSIIWEHPNDSLDDQLDALFAAAKRVVAQIGTWDKARPPAPPKDQVRLCFLTPSGLHFGQAHMNVMSKDPMGGQVLRLAGGLMQALIDRATAGSAA